MLITIIISALFYVFMKNKYFHLEIRNQPEGEAEHSFVISLA
jgi:hypothetical protein